MITIHFITRENYLYYWDLANYWSRVVRLAESVASDPYRGLRGAIRSIRHDDYNDLPSLLLLPAMAFFGYGRLPYILSIVNILAFAAAVSFGLLHHAVSRLSPPQPGPAAVPLISAALLLLSPAFWSPIFYGYPDVGGLVIVNLILLLYLRASSPEGDIRADLTLALLIPLLILFRRWYAYWAVSFYVALIVERCFSLGVERVSKPSKVLLVVITQAGISGLLLGMLAPAFTARIMTTSYADIYSAYRFSGSLLDAIARLVAYFGLIPLALFVGGAVQAVRSKATRHLAVLLLVQWVVIVYAFSRTQDFGHQHFYLLLPAVLLFSALLIARLVVKSRLLATGGILALLAVNAAGAFGVEGLRYGSISPYVFTGMRHAPLVRGDIPEIDRMLGILGEVLTHAEDRVYVLASSGVLNSSILRSAHLSLGRHRGIGEKVLSTHDVDLRDGFPAGLVNASHVLVAEPVQYHLRPRDQRVVGVPAELVLTGRGIGASLVRLPYEFRLDGGVKAYLYGKAARFRAADLTALSDTFRRYYPGRPRLYQLPQDGGSPE